jgi:hypothetical protein
LEEGAEAQDPSAAKEVERLERQESWVRSGWERPAPGIPLKPSNSIIPRQNLNIMGLGISEVQVRDREIDSIVSFF